eukprot:gene14033-15493_t
MSSLITDTFKQVKGTRNRHAKSFQKSNEVSKLKEQPITIKKDKFLDEVKDLEMLRQFDLEAEYGPCIGITRIERWERAEKFGLSPPKSVKKLIDDHAADERYLQW